ncbi:hypothetical protein ACOMHN_060467 [Nucella lapillus]
MTTCGTIVCYDDNAYCCLDDDGYESCCISNYYYQTWWFWFMWGFFLLILVSCFVGCFRACRTRRNRYVILGGQTTSPVYGSVVVSSNVAHHQTSVGPTPAPSGPVAPPAYVPYPQEKPPAYTAGFP